MEGRHSNGRTCKGPGERPGTRGGLSSSRANSGVGGPPAVGGGGEAGENGSIHRLSRPALPVPEGPSLGRASQKHRVSAEGEEPRGSEGRGLPWTQKGRPCSPLHS